MIASSLVLNPRSFMTHILACQLPRLHFGPYPLEVVYDDRQSAFLERPFVDGERLWATISYW
jgi:hypothetical protein